jgi:hypothetical protein
VLAISPTTAGVLIGGAFTLGGVLLGIFGSYVGQRHAAELDRLRARDERRIADVRRLGELVVGQHVALTARTVKGGTDADEADYRDYLEMLLILERLPNAEFRQQMNIALVGAEEDWNASLANLDDLATVIGTELRRLEDG